MKISCKSEEDYNNCLKKYEDKILIIKFSADWCGPCKKLSPLVEKISKSREDIILINIDVDTNADLCKKFNVKSIPHCVIKYKSIKNEAVVGFKPNDLVEILQKTIKDKENETQ